MLGAIINFSLNLILIRSYASIGASISTVIAEGIIAIMYIFYSNEVINFRDILKIFYNKLLAGLVMCCIVLLLKHILAINWLSLIIMCTMGAVTYFMVLYLLKDKFFIEITNMFKNKLGGTK